MEKLDLGIVKTTKRIRNRVTQTLHLYNKDQRKLIMDQVEDRPANMTIVDVLNIYGISPAVYHSWKRVNKKKVEIFYDNVNHPNKTFVLDTVIDSDFGKKHHLIIVVAKNRTTAQWYLKEKLGWKGDENELTWLMNTNHTTLYDQTGNHPLEVQAKIQYNSTTSIDVKSYKDLVSN